MGGQTKKNQKAKKGNRPTKKDAIVNLATIKRPTTASEFMKDILQILFKKRIQTARAKRANSRDGINLIKYSLTKAIKAAANAEVKTPQPISLLPIL